MYYLNKFTKHLLVIVVVLILSSILGFVGPISTLAAGPVPVNLRSTGNFAILSKAGITNTGSHTSAITGNIGSSPITAAAMNNVWCSEITGTIYGVDAAYIGSGATTCFAGNPPLSNKTLVDIAVRNMETAYTNAAGRPNGVGPNLNMGGGTLNGQNFAPGTYTWNTPGNVTITGDITLTGSATDVWIFQISGTLNISSGKKIILGGSALASNIFWQVAGATTLGTYSTFNGNILDKTMIALQTGATLNGRALAQTQVTLDASTVSAPNNTPTIIPTATPTTGPSPTITPTITPTPTPMNVLGEIRGTKYEDRDGDGKLTCYDNRLLSGWTIFLDTNNNGLFDSGEPSTITDSRGNYRFSSLPAGMYQVREEDQLGWIQTYPSSGLYTIVLTAGKISKNNNFGNFKLGSISGMKFNDANGNRRKDNRKDNSEVGLQNWTINLTKIGSSIPSATLLTDANGNYSFTNLGPGTYQVREIQQAGWVQTTNNPPNIKVLSGTVSSNYNFGNHYGPVKKDKNKCFGFCN